MREELAYTTTLPSFLAAASIAAQSWSRLKKEPSWFCSCQDFGADVGGTAVGWGTLVAGGWVGAVVAGAPQPIIKLSKMQMVKNLRNVFISFSFIHGQKLTNEQIS